VTDSLSRHEIVGILPKSEDAQGFPGVHAMVFNLTGARVARPIAGRTLTGSRSRPRAAGGRKERRATFSTLIESLERRTYLTASPIVSGFSESDVVSLTWQGRQVEAIRDSWSVQMPTPANLLAINAAGYQSRAPQVPKGWAIESLNFGFYSMRAPGASLQDVTAWAQSRGATLIEPNFVLERAAVPNDPRYGDGSLWGLDQINGPATWDTTSGSRSIVLGVVDSGVDVTHPDLAANIWRNPGETAGNGIDDDGNGYVDDINGWNFGNNNADLSDTVGHGTHVAGTMGAVGNNGVGVAGVNWVSSLMVLKLGDVPTTTAATSAINYVTSMRGRGIPIVATNNSYGGPGASSTFEQAIRLNHSAGVLFIAAAGNSASNNDAVAPYPANYDVPNVISVAASNQTDGLTDFSNYGTNTVDIAAPGIGILSTVPTSEDPSGYAVYQGTSMAAPHVAGVAGLLAAAYLDATGELPSVTDMKAALLDGAEVIPTVPGASGLTNPRTRGVVAGNRRLDALGSLDYLLNSEASVQVLRPSGREGRTGTTAVEFTIRLSKTPMLGPIDVTYTTVDDTAIGGEDYVAASGTVTFQPGDLVKVVTVQVNGDLDLEEDESFGFVLTDVVNGRLGVQRASQYTIVNDEPPLVSIKPAVVIEKNGHRVSADFEVTTVGDAQAPVMVSYTTRDGTAVARRDYVPTQGTLVFLPGETTKRISVKVVGDRDVEDDEAFMLVVSGVRNGMTDEQSLAVPGYIVDDDSRVVSVSTVAPTVRGGDEAVFRVALERIGGFPDVFPALPDGVDAPEFVISATVGTVSQAATRGVPRALAGSDYTTVSQRLTFSPAVREHLVRVPTHSVEARRGFVMRVASVEGASIGTATAGSLILSASGDSGAETFTGRPAGRAGNRIPIAVWRGLAGRR